MDASLTKIAIRIKAWIVLHLFVLEEKLEIHAPPALDVILDYIAPLIQLVDHFSHLESANRIVIVPMDTIALVFQLKTQLNVLNLELEKLDNIVEQSISYVNQNAAVDNIAQLRPQTIAVRTVSVHMMKFVLVVENPVLLEQEDAQKIDATNTKKLMKNVNQQNAGAHA